MWKSCPPLRVGRLSFDRDSDTQIASTETAGTQTITRAAQVLACFSAERPHLKLIEFATSSA